ncbi:ribonuclease P protein subunit p14 [Tribolium madens]|uniref:ribonuclease P protein subunit p14 n=1 Tax=Tribolium madens TaxID=41895 RepID=UPI001CF742F6|nr:ribonuclease P protein subunit p14 [Tribolium madens]
MSKYYYLDISLRLHDNPDYELTVVYFKKHIIGAVSELFGEAATCIDIDVLKYNSLTRRGILKVPAEYYVKIRSSLTLCGSFNNVICSYKIHKASPLLLNLQGDSREYEH